MAGKYYWFKLKNDFFIDPKIKKIRKLAGGDTYTIIMLKIMLLSIRHDGVLLYEAIEDNLADELSLSIDEDTENIQATLIFMEKMKLIEKIDNSSFLLPQVLGLIGSEGDSAERVRKHREREQTKLLQCNTNVRTCNTEKSLDLKKEVKKDLDLDLDLDLEKNYEIETEDETQKFRKFRDKIKKIYSGNGDKNFYPTLFWYGELEIALNENGFLYAKYQNEGLDKKEALKIWNYIYKNQNEIIEANNHKYGYSKDKDNEYINPKIKEMIKINKI
jgi:predicted phage replisome organizer